MLGMKLDPNEVGEDGKPGEEPTTNDEPREDEDDKDFPKHDEHDEHEHDDVDMREKEAHATKQSKTAEELEKEREEAEEQKKVDDDALRRRREELQKEKEAEQEKEKGNKFYEEKKFTEALQCYQKAFESNPKNPAYLLNQSAVLFMEEKWDECMEKCQAAVAVCREHFCDLKWTFKAFSRMGNIEEKRGNREKAIEYYRKALVEQKDETLRKKLKSIENEHQKQREQDYLDPEKSQVHKDQGNTFFKNGKWQEAIVEYSEAIRRNPKDPLLYSNRATTYCKLMGWEAALKDCDTCLKIDSNFIKAWIRQGKIFHVLKQYHKSLMAYRKAAEIDANNSDLKNAKQDTMRAIQERNTSGEMDENARQRALEDPEIKAAMNDPEVSSVLLQAQSGDQSIVFRAMRDKPRIAEKIELLLAAGVLQMVSK